MKHIWFNVLIIALTLFSNIKVAQAQTYHIGDVITNDDGSRGVVFWLNPDGSGGWMCALNDLDRTYAWSSQQVMVPNFPALPRPSSETWSVFSSVDADTAGYSHTERMRAAGTASTYPAAYAVDLEHGWYLPTIGQIRMLYAMQATLEPILTANGGNRLNSSYSYWSSTYTNASTAYYIRNVGQWASTTKTISNHIRPICNFHINQNASTHTYRWNTGDTTDHITVSPDTTTTYQVVVTNDAGCSDTVDFTLYVNSPISQSFSETACGSYEWHGQTYTESGIYTYSHEDAHGCTQVDTLHLTINTATNLSYTEVAYNTYTWTTGNGETYTTSGTYYYTHSDANGCNQVDTLYLTVYYSSADEFSAVACGFYQWNDSIYRSSGDYVQRFTDIHGADSVMTLHLTINHPVHQSHTEIACESYEWTDGNGQTYTESGTYTYSHEDTNGCTQVDTLHLTINNPAHQSFTEAACESYAWTDGNGQTYTESGIYTYSHEDAHGCTQVDTLHLTINNPDTVRFNETVCQGEPYNGHGFNIPADSTMTPHVIVETVCRPSLQTGCDSCTILTLTISPAPEANIQSTADTICQGESATLSASATSSSSTGSFTPPVIAIGDILCTDNSIVKPSDWPVAGKTAMGVVFYVDNSDQHGWAVALKEFANVTWGPHSSSYTDFTNSDDVPGIPNSTNARDALGDENGMTNTNAIRTKYGSSFSNCQAAYRCYYYNHSTGTYGSTHQGWYLPAAGQLRKLFAELPALNATLTHLGTAAQQFTQNPYWSSSEASYLNAWGIINSGALVDSNKHNSFPYARPVRAF